MGEARRKLIGDKNDVFTYEISVEELESRHDHSWQAMFRRSLVWRAMEEILARQQGCSIQKLTKDGREHLHVEVPRYMARDEWDLSMPPDVDPPADL